MTGWHIDMDWAELLGYLAAACTLAACSMKTMIPLRIAGIASNCLFIIYGFFGSFYPPLFLHLILLPLNISRLYQMIRLVKKVREASRSDLSMDWLKPFMTKRRYRKGDVLFRKGDAAAEMFYTVTGRFRLNEAGIDVAPGQVFGELGLLAPDNRRTQTLECLQDGEVLTISYKSVEQLYFQNPKFGFFFLRLASERLFRDVERLEDELACQRSSAAAR